MWFFMSIWLVMTFRACSQTILIWSDSELEILKRRRDCWLDM